MREIVNRENSTEEGACMHLRYEKCSFPYKMPHFSEPCFTLSYRQHGQTFENDVTDFVFCAMYKFQSKYLRYLKVIIHNF